MQVAKRKQAEPEDPKIRRRRLYKIISEERPIFPVQERNFHAMVMDNKEVIKLLSILNTCMQEFKPVRQFMEIKRIKSKISRNAYYRYYRI